MTLLWQCLCAHVCVLFAMNVLPDVICGKTTNLKMMNIKNTYVSRLPANYLHSALLSSPLSEV